MISASLIATQMVARRSNGDDDDSYLSFYGLCAYISSLLDNRLSKRVRVRALRRVNVVEKGVMPRRGTGTLNFGICRFVQSIPFLFWLSSSYQDCTHLLGPKEVHSKRRYQIRFLILFVYFSLSLSFLRGVWISCRYITVVSRSHVWCIEFIWQVRPPA